MRIETGTRDRLREIESELIEIAMCAHAPSERDYAEALMHEVRRIERVATGNVTDALRTPPVTLRTPER
jgi:hypothetical protein